MSGPVIWALTGDKTGDNNQLLALAEAVGLPFTVKRLSYNLARAVPPRFLGTSLVSLTRAARAELTPPWPDLVIAIGRRSVATARWLKARHGARLVLMGHPRVDPRHFDLVITTRQYPVPRHDNVILLPMPLSRLGARPEPNAAEAELFAALPRPHLLLALGGPTKYWQLEEQAMAEAARHLVARAERLGGTVLAIGSRRTPPGVLVAVAGALGGRHGLVLDPAIRFASLMHDADEIFVTADSISMLSEAIQTRKPVGMVPITLSERGRKVLGEEVGERRHRRRDLRHIWAYLEREGLVGSIDKPKRGDWDGSAVAEAAAAVRRLLETDHG